MPEEAKVWYVMDALSKAALHYKRLGFTHGDIQPRTVHLTPNSEVVLMDNMVLHPKGRDSLAKALANPAYKGTLSPLQLDALSKKEKEARHDAYASEVWSIGLTALCYAAGGDVSAFYDWNKKEFKDKVFNVEINRMVKVGYSESIVSVFKCLLDKDETKRPSIEELSECLAKTEQKKIVSQPPPQLNNKLNLIEVPSLKKLESAWNSAPPVEPGSPVRNRDPLEFAAEQAQVGYN
jgi:hypothetical protein